MESTDICNMALSFIAKGRIDSLDEKSENARQCKIHYDHIRQQLLSAQRWGFAERTAKLALLAKEIPGWDFVYVYPQHCLGIRQLYNEEFADRRQDEYSEYTVITVSDSTKAICTNIEDAWADYTVDVENADIFSPDFAEALARTLASALAIPLVGSASLQQQQYQLAQYALMHARTYSEEEHHHKPRLPTAYFDSRN